MNGRWTTIAACIVAAGVGGTAQAQVTRDDAVCRSTVWRAASKLGATAMKAPDICLKQQLSGAAPVVDCNDVGAADKVTAAAAKLAVSVTAKCADVSNAAALASLASCPSPGQTADDGGATLSIDTFDEVASCQTALNVSHVESLRRYILAPSAPEVAASPRQAALARCARAIGKTATKLWRTVSNERGKCQRTLDKGGGLYDYGCATFDGRAKIAGASAKLADLVGSACAELSAPELGLLGSCASTTPGVVSCVTSAVLESAGGLTANAFLHRGVCPTSLRVTTKAGNADGGRVNVTDFDFGWTGLAHDSDFFEGLPLLFALDCATDDCEVCDVSAVCDDGNCRCSDDPSVQCDTPFVAGGPCGAGTCVVHFGPPRSRIGGGVPTCVVDTIGSPLGGTADAGTGTLALNWTVASRIHVGISLDLPCPRCSALMIGDVGVCQGGPRNGLACRTDAIDPDFGPSSYDCPPAPASNVTGPDGLVYDVVLSDQATSLVASDSCDAPLESYSCHCGVCSGDPLVACTDDATCTNLGAGTCEGVAPVLRKPNDCADLVCSPLTPGADQGVCAEGPEDKFCDGLVRANGEGYVSCSTTADCTPLAAGACTQSRLRDCFLPTITSEGTATFAGGVLSAVTCVPGGASASVNGAAGLPGAFRMRIAADYTSYCPDGVTEYALGGASCP